MDWATAIASNPLTPWGIVGVFVIAIAGGLLQPWRNVKRERDQADARILRAEVLAAAAVEAANTLREDAVKAAEKLRTDEVARVEKLHERSMVQKDELLTEQRATIRSLTESVRMYARAAEADITTADIVKNVVQALQADSGAPHQQHYPQRQLEEGAPNG